MIPLPTPLPPAVAEALWRGDALGRGTDTVWPSGFDALDAELPGGGWPGRQLTEVLMPQFSLAEWRLAGPALRRVVADGAAVALVGPPKRPHLPGLLHLGLDERHLVWIQAQAPSERLWCAEQLIKSNAAGAVLAWMPQASPEQLRRLQVLAQSFEGPVFLFRPLAARHDPSPAPLRVEVTVDIDWALNVRILKRKGPAHETPLRLASIPGGLARVLTPRTMQPGTMRPVAPVPEAVPAPATASAPEALETLGSLEAALQAAPPASTESPRARVALALFPESPDVVGRADPAASSAGAV
ncbi:translesion DNA synthesis-associated protein ImuA [Mitsuaria sp. GD03876]|uniref:translesion DNA synthesis-associated protein ImuA n=1 Tax=Mitsuaria sp. GD03876 TaxID=2975399 RepID=UPI00244B96F5|nr:translesion DNA synthesis-associated protein ImuA [Mitsuaria sp. GD03876]MDH0867452.1 translesion DNA synthesis-associated protein ImuA [Mitsuaria sp. GD03876]